MEHKYRAWDKQRKKMFYVPCIWFSLQVASLGMGEENYQIGFKHIVLKQSTQNK